MTIKTYLPNNTRVYAIGDIHGGFTLLTKMMGEICECERIQPKKETVYLIFLGDYIDRGEGSKQVVDYLLNDLPVEFTPIFIKGNHEEMLLKAIADHDDEARLKAFNTWCFCGGKNTIESYGQAFSDNDVKPIFPEEHLNFFNTLRLSFELGEYFFCHAGVYPDAPLDQQLACDLLWIRNLFLNSRANFGKIVVHGHTPCTPFHHGNRIALDHGSVVNGKLAAVRLEEDGSHDILIVSHIEKWRNG